MWYRNTEMQYVVAVIIPLSDTERSMVMLVRGEKVEKGTGLSYYVLSHFVGVPPSIRLKLSMH